MDVASQPTVRTALPQHLTEVMDTSPHCPTCASDISAEKLAEISARLGEERLRNEERFRREKEAVEARLRHDAAAAEARVRQQFDAKLAAAATEREQLSAKVEEAEARVVRAGEQATAAAEVRVRRELDAKLAAANAERDLLSSKVKEAEARVASVREQATAAAEARVRQELDSKLAAATAECDLLSGKVKEAEAREASIRKEATAAAEARVRKELDAKLAAATAECDLLSGKVKEAEAREAGIRKQATAAAEARVRQELDAKLAAATAECDLLSGKVKEAEAREASVRAAARQVLDVKLAAATAEREQLVKSLEESTIQYRRDLEQQRAALENDREKKILELMAERSRERDQLQEKVSALQRKLEHRTANELGEGAEVDVFEALREAFTTDDITRVKKGQPGADIRHGVVHKGRRAGEIVLDSKNRDGWQHGYVTKLHEDQVAANADYAILATTVFPAGKKEFYVDAETGVVVVRRSRAVEIAGLLRRVLISMHVLGLSLEQREEKKAHLYAFLTSERYRRDSDEAVRLIQELANIDVDEAAAHEKVWLKRGRCQTQIRNLLRGLDTEISALIENAVDPAGEETA